MNTRLMAAIGTVALYSTSAFAWNVSIEKDAMTGKENREASIQSKDSHNLKFPYGKVSARLVVRKHARYGRDVIFVASGGQIPCRSYDHCSILVRFDDGKPQRFSGKGPSDGSSTHVFLDGYERFVVQAAKASAVLIEVEFWSNGNRLFSFDPKGFPPEFLPAKHKK